MKQTNPIFISYLLATSMPFFFFINKLLGRNFPYIISQFTHITFTIKSVQIWLLFPMFLQNSSQYTYQWPPYCLIQWTFQFLLYTGLPYWKSCFSIGLQGDMLPCLLLYLSLLLLCCRLISVGITQPSILGPWYFPFYTQIIQNLECLAQSLL